MTAKREINFDHHRLAPIQQTLVIVIFTAVVAQLQAKKQ